MDKLTVKDIENNRIGGLRMTEKLSEVSFEELKQNRKKRRIIGIIVAILISGAGVFTYLKMNQPDNDRPSFQVATVEKGDVTETISASGTVQAAKRISLDFSSTGSEDEILTTVAVNIGDKVKKGQLLAKVDTSEVQVAVSNAEANLVAAEAKLAEAKEGPTIEELAIQKANITKAQIALNEAKNTFDNEQAKQKVDSAKRDLQNAQNDYNDQVYFLKENIVSQSEVDDAKRTLEQAKADYNTTQLEYKKTIAQSKQTLQETQASYDSALAQYNQLVAPSNESTIKSAEATVMQAKAELQQRKLELSSLTLVAPMDGTIVQVNGDLGAVPENPFIVMDNSDSTNLEVLAQVSQGDIGKIKTGMNASFTSTSFEDEVFKGKVTKIYPEASTESGVTTYDVLLTIDNSKNLLMTGMSVSATIEVGTHKNTLYIPTSALQERSGKDGVLVMGDKTDSKASSNENGDSYQFKEITVGYYTSERVEVTDGLSEGEQIVIPFQTLSTTSNSTTSNKQGGMPGMGGGFIGGGMMPSGGGRR